MKGAIWMRALCRASAPNADLGVWVGTLRAARRCLVVERVEPIGPAFPVEITRRGEPWPRAEPSRAPQGQASRTASPYASAGISRRCALAARLEQALLLDYARRNLGEAGG